MSNEQIKETRARLDQLNAAIDAINETLIGLRESVLENADDFIAGRCDVCGEPIFEGEAAHSSEEEFYCPDHAPTWQDLLDGAKDLPAGAWDEPIGKDEFLEMCQAKINAGAGEHKHIWRH